LGGGSEEMSVIRYKEATRRVNKSRDLMYNITTSNKTALHMKFMLNEQNLASFATKTKRGNYVK
jgi:hypothetical protein